MGTTRLFNLATRDWIIIIKPHVDGDNAIVLCRSLTATAIAALRPLRPCQRVGNVDLWGGAADWRRWRRGAGADKLELERVGLFQRVEAPCVEPNLRKTTFVGRLFICPRLYKKWRRVGLYFHPIRRTITKT